MRAVIPWHPHGTLSVLRDFDELLERVLGTGSAGAFLPAVEWFTRGGDLVVRADLPGIDPKAIDVSVEGDRLTIKGERKNEAGDARLPGEVYYGRFERGIRLPERVDADSAKATYRDGVIEVVMKAPRALVSRKVPVTVH